MRVRASDRPEPVDGMTYNGVDPLAQSRAEHREHLAKLRKDEMDAAAKWGLDPLDRLALLYPVMGQRQFATSELVAQP